MWKPKARNASIFQRGIFSINYQAETKTQQINPYKLQYFLLWNQSKRIVIIKSEKYSTIATTHFEGASRWSRPLRYISIYSIIKMYLRGSLCPFLSFGVLPVFASVCASSICRGMLLLMYVLDTLLYYCQWDDGVLMTAWRERPWIEVAEKEVASPTPIQSVVNNMS